MDRVRNIGGAAARASLAGGPLVAVMSGIGILLSGNPIHTSADQLAQLGGIIVMMTVVGWFVAIIPNLIGSIVLGWLGRFNVGMRMPVVWAMVGAAAAGLPAWLTSNAYDRAEMTAAMAGIGAVSALLCRAKVRWDDDNAAPPVELTPARPRAKP